MSWICKQCSRGFQSSRALMVHSNSCKGVYKYKEPTITVEQSYHSTSHIVTEAFNSNISVCADTNNDDDDLDNDFHTVKEEYDIDDDLLKKVEEHVWTCIT